ncbi:hypothetical protein B0H14DRAFT_3739039 [Mycena olivaceomarginata]|nr:hypothetical protein B0H14DRAFT_3739039 [Mycena olivaceomarginata]
MDSDPNAGGQDPPDSEALVKVDGLWFMTDTIVIRVENKIFRVSRGILAARSTVFNDMIAFPQPNSGETETMDGSPVVRLHDSAEDVEAFLRAIYDSSYFLPAPASNHLSVVVGILRLSHKYGCQYLHRRALEHLHADGWYSVAYDKHGPEHLNNGIPEFCPTHWLRVIQAATEVGALWLLPFTYYGLSTHSSEALLPFLEGTTGPHVAKALAAHTHLVRAMVAIHRFLTVYTSCDTPQSCGTARISSLSDLMDELEDPELTPLPRDLQTIAVNINDLEFNGMCSDCREYAKIQMHEAASAFWDELPSIFGLPPWGELHAMKRAAMGEDED